MGSAAFYKFAGQKEYERRRDLALSLVRACFRLQQEAIAAAGRFIPLIVENVVGMQKWLERSRFVYGPFHLWGDIPALMPKPAKAQKNTGGSWFGQCDGKPLERNDPRDMRRNESGEFVNAATVGGWNHPGKALDGRKRPGIKISKGFNNWPKDADGKYILPDGTKMGGGWWHDSTNNLIRKSSSRSAARKAASARIAKIPFPLAQHIARVYKPDQERCA